jgi:hypothetical protein
LEQKSPLNIYVEEADKHFDFMKLNVARNCIVALHRYFIPNAAKSVKQTLSNIMPEALLPIAISEVISQKIERVYDEEFKVERMNSAESDSDQIKDDGDKMDAEILAHLEKTNLTKNFSKATAKQSKEIEESIKREEVPVIIPIVAEHHETKEEKVAAFTKGQNIVDSGKRLVITSKAASEGEIFNSVSSENKFDAAIQSSQLKPVYKEEIANVDANDKPIENTHIEDQETLMAGKRVTIVTTVHTDETAHNKTAIVNDKSALIADETVADMKASVEDPVIKPVQNAVPEGLECDARIEFENLHGDKNIEEIFNGQVLTGALNDEKLAEIEKAVTEVNTPQVAAEQPEVVSNDIVEKTEPTASVTEKTEPTASIVEKTPEVAEKTETEKSIETKITYKNLW